MSIKHPQFILAVTNQHCIESGLGLRTYTRSEDAATVSFHEQIEAHLFIGQRDRLDNRSVVQGIPGMSYKGDRNYRQLLPYTVLTKVIDGVPHYLTYRRGAGVGESRLSGNASIGFGGHIDLEDIVHTNSSIDLMTTLEESRIRELEEELRAFDSEGKREAIRLMFYGQMTLRSHGIIYDNSDDVGLLHLGLVQILEVPEGYTFECNEDELEFEGWRTAEQILSTNCENWTRIVLESESA